MQKVGAYHGVAGEGDDRYLFTDNQLKVAKHRWEREGKPFFVTDSTELMHVISQLNSEIENKNVELRQMGTWLKETKIEAERQVQVTNEYWLKTQSIRYLLRQIIRVIRFGG